MIVPYLAVIKDSFREALASRVLWILLIMITVLLLALAPFGYHLRLSTEFDARELVDSVGLATRIAQAAQDEQPSPGRRIWLLWDEEDQQAVRELLESADQRNPEYFRAQSQLVESLNELVRSPELYDASVWPADRLPDEARKLLETQRRSEQQQKRLNRLLIWSSFPQYFGARPRESVVLVYGPWELPEFPAGLSPELFSSIIETWILSMLTGLVGAVAVFLAVLVTSSIIPQMFDPGSLHLLLSKPVSRSLLFLSKFLGGCAFVLLNIAYLNVGLWLIAGVRLKIWNEGLLYAIPLYLFLFSIYYCISALAGVIWRSAVVSVVMTVLFWFVCFVVGVAHAGFEAVLYQPNRIVRLLQAGDDLITLTESGATQRWAADTREWQPVFLDSRDPTRGVIGPYFDAERQRLIAAVGFQDPASGQSGPQSWTVLFGDQSTLYQQVEGPQTPSGTFTLLKEPDSALIAVSTSGLTRFDGELQREPEQMNLFGIKIPLSGSGQFQPAGPEPSLSLTVPLAAAAHPQRPELLIYSRGQLMRLERGEQGTYQVIQRRPLYDEVNTRALVSMAGDHAVVASADGLIQLLRANTLEPVEEFRLEQGTQPRFLQADPQGRWFSILFHTGYLYLLDVENRSLARADVGGQGDISGVAHPAEGQLMVADRTSRVRQYGLPNLELDRQWVAASSTMDYFYRYLLEPLYTVFPKPGELDRTLQYLLTGRETTNVMAPLLGTGDLAARQENLRPWAPVWSSLLFVVVVLGLSCLYIERQEF